MRQTRQMRQHRYLEESRSCVAAAVAVVHSIKGILLMLSDNSYLGREGGGGILGGWVPTSEKSAYSSTTMFQVFDIS